VDKFTHDSINRALRLALYKQIIDDTQDLA